MSAKSGESPLAILLAGLLEAILSILLIPFYVILGIFSIITGSFAIFVIGLLFLILLILCSLTGLVL